MICLVGREKEVRGMGSKVIYSQHWGLYIQTELFGEVTSCSVGGENGEGGIGGGYDVILFVRSVGGCKYT